MSQTKKRMVWGIAIAALAPVLAVTLLRGQVKPAAAAADPRSDRARNVDIDHRGLVYASDRVGTGLFILEYTGAKKKQGT